MQSYLEEVLQDWKLAKQNKLEFSSKDITSWVCQHYKEKVASALWIWKALLISAVWEPLAVKKRDVLQCRWLINPSACRKSGFEAFQDQAESSPEILPSGMHWFIMLLYANNTVYLSSKKSGLIEHDKPLILMPAWMKKELLAKGSGEHVKPSLQSNEHTLWLLLYPILILGNEKVPWQLDWAIKDLLIKGMCILYIIIPWRMLGKY